MLAGPLRAQRPGAAQPVQERGGAHQRRAVGRDAVSSRPIAASRSAGPQPGQRADPAGDDHAAAEPAAAQAGSTSRSTCSLCQPNRAVATASPAPSASRTTTSRWLASRSSSACSTRTRAAGHGTSAPAMRSSGVAVGQRVRDRGDSLGPLGQQHPVGDGHALEPLLDPAVLVEHPHVQVRDVLAGRFHQVLDGLHHAGADRAVRDREQPGPGHMARQRARDRARRPRRGPGAPGRGRGLPRAQRQDQRLQPRMPVRDDAEQVMDLPLVPERGAAAAGSAPG